MRQMQCTDSNRTLMLLNDALADPQAQACSFFRLCSKEGFEDSFSVLGQDSRPRVENRHSYSTAVGRKLSGFAHAYCQAPALRHGLQRVGGEVEQHLFQLNWKPENDFPGSVFFHHGNALQLQEA